MKTKRIIILLLDSTLRTALVAGLVFVFAWSLVQWAAYRPAVEADADGVFRLLAEDAVCHGPPEIRFNTFAGEKNIGWWDFDSQWLEWKVDVETAGKYDVSLRYSRPGEVSTGLELVVGGATLATPVPGSGGWDRWKEVDLGEIELAVGEGQMATLKAFDLPSEGVINFVELVLTPW